MRGIVLIGGALAAGALFATRQGPAGAGQAPAPERVIVYKTPT